MHLRAAHGLGMCAMLSCQCWLFRTCEVYYLPTPPPPVPASFPWLLRHAVALGLIFIAKLVLSRHRGDLVRCLWPQNRRVGVSTANNQPIALSDVDSNMIIMLAIVDMFFRCAAYAQPQVGMGVQLGGLVRRGCVVEAVVGSTQKTAGVGLS